MTNVWAQAPVVEDIMGMYSRNAQQVIGLANAFPDDLYNWSPAEGVRSVGTALTHVAQANYFFSKSLGFELPEGVNPGEMGDIKDKAEIIAAVENSFEFVTEHCKGLDPSVLGDMVTLPFGEFSRHSVLLLLLEHSGEHKGQLIAYARMNGITPPGANNQHLASLDHALLFRNAWFFLRKFDLTAAKRYIRSRFRSRVQKK